MDDFFKIQCPGCQNVLVVRRRDGHVVEVRKPVLEQSTGDRFEDAMIKVKSQADAAAKKFEEARAREKNKMDRLNSLFDEGLKRAKQSPSPERPINPLDLD
jgi:hypothetical protein